MPHSTLTETGVCCPFCGHARSEAVGPCPRCTMEDTPNTRAATAARVGPWFVLQRKNPTAPGLRYSVLLSLIKRGLVTTDSVLRGPTTQQLWRRATQVQGVARAFGVCWNCNSSVAPEAGSCARCGQNQEPPADPDLFLEPSRDNASSEAGPAEKKTIDDGFESEVPSTPKREFIARDLPNRAAAAEAIMSARELAAVFQLNPSAVREPSKSRRVLENTLKFALATLLIATTGVAALLYVKPELREPIKKKLGLKGSESPPVVTDDFQLPSLAIEEPHHVAIASDSLTPASPSDPVTTQPSDESDPTVPLDLTALPEIETSSSPQRPTSDVVPSWLELFEENKLNDEKAVQSDSLLDDMLTVESENLSPATEPTSLPAVEIEPSDPVAEEIIPPDVDSPPEASDAPAPAPQVEPTIKESEPSDFPTMPQLADPHEQLRELRLMAADFERRSNFAYAIRCYELMRDLPEEVRPTNIETQIDRLSRRAGMAR